MARTHVACAITVVAVALGLMVVRAQPTNGAERDDHGAYQWAMKCYVADGHALGERRRAGDSAKASYYESKAHLSFDTAVKLGGALNLSGPDINRDFETMEVSELPLLIKDNQYFLSVAGTCKALGLM